MTSGVAQNAAATAKNSNFNQTTTMRAALAAATQNIADLQGKLSSLTAPTQLNTDYSLARAKSDTTDLRAITDDLKATDEKL